MILEVILRTIVPIILLIVIGFASRHFRIFKPGDEKVLCVLKQNLFR